MKTLVLFCIAICLQGIPAAAQTKPFVPGFYVNHKGDTLKGHLSINRPVSASTFRFKETPQGDATQVSFDSSRLLVTKNATYLSRTVTRSMTYVDLFDFTIRLPDSSVTAAIPLRLLHTGPRFSLYHYHDKRDHFFIGHDGTIEELSVTYRYATQWERQKYFVNPPTYFTNPMYRGQLPALMHYKLTRRQQNLVEVTEYEERSLIKLLKALEREK
jgi:hypothetical protein